MLHDQEKVIAVRNFVVPDKTAGFAFLHAFADGIQSVGEANWTGEDRIFSGVFSHISSLFLILKHKNQST